GFGDHVQGGFPLRGPQCDRQGHVPRPRFPQPFGELRNGFDVDPGPTQVVEMLGHRVLDRVPGTDVDVATRGPLPEQPGQDDVLRVLRVGDHGSWIPALRASSFRSWSTIIATSDSKSTSGFQPSSVRALVASPTSRSTSAGRKKRSSWVT